MRRGVAALRGKQPIAENRPAHLPVGGRFPEQTPRGAKKHPTRQRTAVGSNCETGNTSARLDDPRDPFERVYRLENWKLRRAFL